MCTSSMMKTLYFPTCGGMRVWSISVLMFSTELLLAASSSKMLYERWSLKAWQLSQWLHASPISVGVRQLMALAKMRAQVVLPTPRGPQKRYACANFPLLTAFFSVVVRADWPTTESKDTGRYLRADTIYSPIKCCIVFRFMCLVWRWEACPSPYGCVVFTPFCKVTHYFWLFFWFTLFYCFSLFCALMVQHRLPINRHVLKSRRA